VDDDVKTRFEELEKRLLTTDKRFDDIKWYFGGVTTLFTIGFSVLTLALSWNYANEKASLRDFQRDLKADLGRIDALPELELLGVDAKPLANQNINAEISQDKDVYLSLTINHFLRNAGNGISGPMFVKLYSSDPVVLDNRSTDEPRFKYEATITPKNLEPNEIPGKYSTEWFHQVNLPKKTRPPKGRYEMLVKVYYGKGKVVQAPFWLVVS